MKSAFLLLVISTFVLTSQTQAELTYATGSSTGILNYAGTNYTDQVQWWVVKIRPDDQAMKSWIKFDISGLDVSSLASAQLRLTFVSNPDTCSVSAVNDDYTVGMDWNNNLTWNNAPGNYTSSDGVNADMAGITQEQLRTELDSTKTTLVGTLDYSSATASGEQFYINVLPILQADTDGIVQFVLHNSHGYTVLGSNYDGDQNGDVYYPALITSTVPEPATLFLMGLGGLLSQRKRRQ